MIMNYNNLKKMEEKIEDLMKDKEFLRINDEIIIKREKRSYLKKGFTENIVKYIACGQWEEYSMFSGSITKSAFEAIMNYNDDKKLDDKKLIEIKVNQNAIELTFENEDFIADFENDLNSYLKFKFNSKKNDIHILLYQKMDITLQVIMIKKLVEYYNSIVYKCDICGNYEYKLNQVEYACSGCGKKRCEECYKDENNYCNECYNEDDYIDNML